MMKSITNLIFGVATIAVCGWAWHTVYEDSLARSQVDQQERSEEPFLVEVIPVRKQMVSQRIELVGSLKPLDEVEIRARVNGYIQKLPFDLGDHVEAGQAVVYLDDKKQQETILQMQAAFEVALAEQKAQEAELVRAEKFRDRVEKLREASAATNQQWDNVLAEAEITRARLVLQKAQVKQASSKLASAKLALEELQIKTPIKGVVAERFVSVGDLARADTPLLRIINLETVQTEVHVVERDYARLAVGQKSILTVDAYPERRFHGTLTRIAPVVDPETRTALVQIEVPNVQRLLKPGMHSRVSIVCDQPHSSSVVPIAALKEEQDERCVFVVCGEPPTVERREVQVGMNDGDIVEITAGLKEGEQVVTLGSRLVHHGQAVTPRLQSWPVSLTASSAGAEGSSAETAED